MCVCVYVFVYLCMCVCVYVHVYVRVLCSLYAGCARCCTIGTVCKLISVFTVLSLASTTPDTDKLDTLYDTRRKMTYQDMIDRDKKRFDAADEDGDGKLTRDEYAIFLHPEDSPHMRDVVISETMQDMDKDKDGFVDKDEYISEWCVLVLPRYC